MLHGLFYHVNGVHYLTVDLRVVGCRDPEPNMLLVTGAQIFNIQRDVVLAEGESAELGGYRMEYIGTRSVPFSDRTEFLSTVQVYREGQLLETMIATRTFYPSFNIRTIW